MSEQQEIKRLKSLHKQLQIALRQILKVPNGVLKCKDDDHWNFYVPFDLLGARQAMFSSSGEATLKKAFPGFEGWIRILPVAPKLVPARLGDFVLIYDEWKVSPKHFSVGIVTAVFKQGKKTCYGCRYIIPTDSHLRPLDCLNEMEVEISEEDYGGYPPGFYKVISREEAIERVAQQVRDSVAKKVEKLQKAAQEAEANVGCLVDQYKHRTSVRSLRTEGIRPKEYR